MSGQHFLLVFETRFYCVALAFLELTARLASNSWRSVCYYLSSAEIKGMPHHAWLLARVLALILNVPLCCVLRSYQEQEA